MSVSIQYNITTGRWISAITLLLYLAGAQVTHGQFVDVSAGLTGMNRGDLVWWDDDANGSLDLLVTGCSVLNDFNDDCADGFDTRLYDNANGSFTPQSISLPGVSSGGLTLGDVDNDGDQDVLVVGRRGGDFAPVASVYENMGDGSFQDFNAGLIAVKFGAADFGDYDNDGDLDIFLTGRDASNSRISRLYRNNGAGSFSQVLVSIPGFDVSSVTWIDYDLDADLDLLISGNNGTSRKTSLYRNDGDARFVEVGSGLVNVDWGSSAFGDFDNDGDPDLLLIGLGESTAQARVYRNNNGSFSDINAALQGAGHGQGAWGDYDNDGLLDILIVGLSDGGGSARVYRNTGAGFVLTETLRGVDYGAAAWGDYDNDGDLDIVMSGLDGRTSITNLYRNDYASESNASPSRPSGLSATSGESDVTLRWSNSTDAETPSNALTYAVRVGTTPGGSEIVSPAFANGTRSLVVNGNAGQADVYRLNDLEPGTYYWSVQAVDHAFVGSGFAEEQSFVTANTPPTVTPFPTVGVNEDAEASTIELTNFFNDAEDGGALSYEIESNSNEALVEPTLLASTLQIGFAKDASGTAVIRLKASDSQGESVSADVDVTVAAVNDPPSFERGENISVQQDAGPQEIANWATAILAGPADEADQAVTFMIETDNDALFDAIPTIEIEGVVGTLRFTPAASEEGTAIVTLHLTDNGGTANGGVDVSPTQVFSINIGQANSAPSVQEIESPTSPAHQEPLFVQAVVSDLESNLERVWIRWTLNGMQQPELEMTEGEVSAYEAEIPGQDGASEITFAIIAADSLGLQDSTQVPISYVVRPEIPSALEAEVAGDQVALRWAASIGVSQYDLYRGDGQGTDLLVQGLTDTTYVDVVDEDVSFFEYSVVAANAGGASDRSTALTVALCQPTPPQLTGVAGPARVVLQWESVGDCDVGGYIVERDEVILDTLSSNIQSFVDDTLDVDSSYSYVVRAKGVANLDSDAGTPVLVMPFAYAQTLSLNTGSLVFNDFTQETSYRLVGLPGNTLIPLDETLEGAPGEDWNAFFDNGVASDALEDFLVEFSSALPQIFQFGAGRGFWIIQNKPWQVARDAASADLALDNTAQIPLHAGWNIITNPFINPVSWDDVQQANDLVEPIWEFSGTFSEQPQMEPYAGYYFFNGREPIRTHLDVPYPGSLNRTGKRRSANNAQLRLIAYGPDTLQSEIYVGFAEDASDGLDMWDRFGPPAAFDGVSLQLINDSLGIAYNALATEYRPGIGSGQVYDVSLTSKGESTTRLRVEGIESLSKAEVYLVDKERAVFYDLHDQQELWIEGGQRERKLRLLIGDQSFVEAAKSEVLPASFELAQNYPNPFAGATAIQYAIPAGTGQTHVKLEVFNALGQRITTLVDGPVAPGRHEVHWQANVANGVYLYRFSTEQFVAVRTMVVIR